MHLNDALFDFQSLAPGQCLVGSGFETPPQEELHTHVVKLYGSPRCCSTARIATVLYEKQIKYELYPLHATDSDAQPYIADDGVILHGCRNVCQYIATRYPDRGTKLTSNSDDTSAMEMFEQAKLTEIQSFEPLAKNALYETLMQRQHGLLPSDAVRGYALQELSNVIEGYESILSHQKYLAGEEISLVDLYHLPYGEMLSNVGIDLLLTKGPNVNRWWKDISSRPSWLAIRNGVPSKC
ncbi:glutathione S-transferase [Lentinula raphanica]|uniref:glutathione transferase n=1 Tax=Lentinula raphanica TaxID=153919 RepID=A0AA38PKF2_9AGAR|nr:glutathione S-transferase [Lentinula raphanica]KAJ3844582.1 glutathione S-transferase [Lentinula raphanica]